MEHISNYLDVQFFKFKPLTLNFVRILTQITKNIYKFFPLHKFTVIGGGGELSSSDQNPREYRWRHTLSGNLWEPHPPPKKMAVLCKKKTRQFIAISGVRSMTRSLYSTPFQNGEGGGQSDKLTDRTSDVETYRRNPIQLIKVHYYFLLELHRLDSDKHKILFTQWLIMFLKFHLITPTLKLP